MSRKVLSYGVDFSLSKFASVARPTADALDRSSCDQLIRARAARHCDAVIDILYNSIIFVLTYGQLDVFCIVL